LTQAIKQSRILIRQLPLCFPFRVAATKYEKGS